MTGLHVVLPAQVDDPALPSGGNRYDRRLCQQLSELGWQVREQLLPGAWPYPTGAERQALARALAELPDGAVVLLDGLVSCPAPEVLAGQAQRLCLVLLVHLPLADETGLTPALAADLAARERRALQAATAVVATSHWSAQRLIDHYGAAGRRVFVAEPGVDPAPMAHGGDGVPQVLCVAAITPRKGQDVLVEALAAVADRPWHCRCVGDVDRSIRYAGQVWRLVERHQLTGRVTLAGPRTGPQLAAAYAGADLVVLPSHAETYGMVVTEALARGIPVVATEVGGVPQALGRAPDGAVPGILVPPARPDALSGALRRWFDEPATRDRLRRAARGRRRTLPTWQDSARSVAAVLAGLTTGAGGRDR